MASYTLAASRQQFLPGAAFGVPQCSYLHIKLNGCEPFGGGSFAQMFQEPLSPHASMDSVQFWQTGAPRLVETETRQGKAGQQGRLWQKGNFLTQPEPNYVVPSIFNIVHRQILIYNNNTRPTPVYLSGYDAQGKRSTQQKRMGSAWPKTERNPRGLLRSSMWCELRKSRSNNQRQFSDSLANCVFIRICIIFNTRMAGLVKTPIRIAIYNLRSSAFV